jgi:hypothetical protein
MMVHYFNIDSKERKGLLLQRKKKKKKREEGKAEIQELV